MHFLITGILGLNLCFIKVKFAINPKGQTEIKSKLLIESPGSKLVQDFSHQLLVLQLLPCLHDPDDRSLENLMLFFSF